MVNGYRYIQIDESGFVSSTCNAPVIIDGEEITIDTEGMTIPEMPTDATYDLYYNETDGLHWVKVAELEKTEPTQLDRIEDALANSDMNAQESRLVIMEAMAAQYEESLERDLENKEVQATIYEELLAINGKL